MSLSDEKEMYRLCAMLGDIAETLPNSSPLSEGLKKAAFAVQVAFIHGHRTWIEDQFRNLEDSAELTEEQRAHLLKLGINPDA
jgi:hypothetical protein